jgi:sugar O-acyltransferase (sialic acid O-acetyltransferase NeuD family)
MSGRHVFVIGAGGHAKVVIATLQAAGRIVDAALDDDSTHWNTFVLGVPVIGGTDRASDLRQMESIIAIGDNQDRRELAGRLDLDWTFAVHPSAVIHPDVPLGPGSVIFAGSVVQPGAQIGAHVIINTSASVDHDCTIADFVHIAPGARVGGTVDVRDGAFLGTGAVVLPNLRVGAWSILGGGAVAVRDVEPRCVVVGVPARPWDPTGKAPLYTCGKAAVVRR